MKFGVFIRSIGERTEGLCYEAVAQSVPEKDIHLLKNYYPSYRAFMQMFELAEHHRYDWYLGLDADVVLLKNWWEIFENKLRNPEIDQYYRLHFHTHDYITHRNLIRGNNWYNGKYTALCKKFLKKNIHIGKYWFVYKYLGYVRGYFIKPETSIRTHMRDKLNVLDCTFDEVIGLHGYEQYNAEIFRQYVTRYHRDPMFIHQEGNQFLRADQQSQLKASQDYDRYVANLAWNWAQTHKLRSVDGRIKGRIERVLESYGIAEKQPLSLGIDDFYANSDQLALKAK